MPVLGVLLVGAIMAVGIGLQVAVIDDDLRLLAQAKAAKSESGTGDANKGGSRTKNEEPFLRVWIPVGFGSLILLGGIVYGAFALAVGGTPAYGYDSFTGWSYFAVLAKSALLVPILGIKGYLAPLVAAVILAYTIFTLAEVGSLRVLPAMGALLEWVLGSTRGSWEVIYALAWITLGGWTSFEKVLDS